MSDLLSTLSTGLAIATGLLTKGQGFLLYIPDQPSDSKTNIDTPLDHGIKNSSLLHLTTPDKTLIYAYFLAQPTINLAIPSTATKSEPYSSSTSVLNSTNVSSSKPTTLIYFHGNAGNFGHRLPLAADFYIKFNLNVILVCYRGYGKSQGTPSEFGFKQDAQTVLDYVLSHDQLKEGKIIIFGQSMGGAVAIDLASRNSDKIDALIVENTFLSIPKLVGTLVPQVSMVSQYICTQPWDSQSKISKLINVPTLFLSGDSDTLIDKSHMEQLFLDSSLSSTKSNGEQIEGNNVAQNVGTKTFVSIPFGTHNDTCTKPSYLKAIANFITTNKLI